MSGHGPIYDWSFYETKDLKKILKLLRQLDSFGLTQDEDLLCSLQEEISNKTKRLKLL